MLGEVADADLKAKFVKVRNQLWNYQKRENDILNRENAVLEKEEANKQVSWHYISLLETHGMNIVQTCKIILTVKYYPLYM